MVSRRLVYFFKHLVFHAIVVSFLKLSTKFWTHYKTLNCSQITELKRLAFIVKKYKPNLLLSNTIFEIQLPRLIPTHNLLRLFLFVEVFL